MLTAMFHLLMMTSRFDLPMMTSRFDLPMMSRFHLLMMTSRSDLLMVASGFPLPLTKARFVDLTLTSPMMTSDFVLAVMTSMFDVALMTSVFVDLVTSMNSFVKNSLLLTVLLTVSEASSV
jgi:hypothetical protein